MREFLHASDLFLNFITLTLQSSDRISDLRRTSLSEI